MDSRCGIGSGGDGSRGRVPSGKNRLRPVAIAALAVGLWLALAAGIGHALAQESGDDQSTTTTPAAGAQTVAADCNGPGGPGPGPGRGMRHAGLAGEVVKVEGSVITVKTLKGEEKAVTVNDQTTYNKQGATATLADVTAGEKVGIRLEKPASEGGELIAKAVMIGDPRANHQRIAGTVTAVNGDTVTIKTDSGEEKQIKVPAITPGMRLGAGVKDDGSVRGLMYDPPQPPADAAANGATQTS